MRICLCIAMHDREYELGLCLKQVEKLKEEFDIEVVIVTSSGAIKEILENRDDIISKYHEGNKPIGIKRNKAMKLAGEHNYDMYVSMGDDHLMTCGYLRYCQNRIDEGFDFVAPVDCYFYDHTKKAALYFPGYTGSRRGEPQGLCKAYSNDLLWRLNFKVTSDNAIKDSDYQNERRLSSLCYRKHLFYMNRKQGRIAVDIKNGRTLNSIEAYLPKGGVYIDRKLISGLIDIG